MENISENSSVGEEEYDFSENTQTSSSTPGAKTVLIQKCLPLLPFYRSVLQTIALPPR